MDAFELRARMAHLPESLLTHIDRTVTLARRLACLHGVDEERAALAAQAHDVARAIPGAELLTLAEGFGIEVDAVQRFEPILLHGPVGACLLARDYAIDDADILDVAIYHTTGRPEMTPVERVVFVADKVDPDKIRRRPELGEVLAVAETDLDLAVLRYLTLEQRRSAERHWLLHPLAVATRNALLLRGVGAPGHAADVGPF